MDKKNSVIFTWILSYAIIIIFNVIVMLVMYTEMYQTLQNEINESNQNILQNIHRQLDDILSEMKALSSQIIFSTNMQNAVSLNDISDGTARYKLVLLERDLNSYQTSNKQINDMFILFNKIDTVVSNGAIADSHSFYDTYLQSDKMSYEQWMKTITQGLQEQYVILYRKDFLGKTVKSIAFVCPVPLVASNEKSAYIVILSDVNGFASVISNINKQNGSELVVLDKDRGVIFSTEDKTVNGGLSFSSFPNDHGAEKFRIDNQDLMISYLYSEVAKWKYLIITPLEKFHQKLKYILNFMYFSLAVTLLGEFFITFLLIRRNYNPIKDIIGFVNSHVKISDGDKGINEYVYIQQAIKATIKENKNMANILTKNNARLKEDVILSLIKGHESADEDRNEMFSTVGIELISEKFAVVIFQAEDLESLFYEAKNMELHQKQSAMQFIIKNVVEELSSKRNKGFVLEVDNMSVCLLNLRNEDTETLREDIQDMIEEAKAFINKHFIVNLTVAASDIHNSAAGIHDAYNEAIYALNYRMVFGKGQTIFYNKISKHSGFRFNYPIYKEQQLINCIKIGDEVNARQILDELFQSNMSGGDISLYTAKCLMINLLSTILKAVGEISLDYEEITKQLNLISLIDSETIQDIKAGMANTINSLCRQMNEKIKNINYFIKDKVIEFIEQNYTDKNLSITSIGDSLGISAKYLSKIFKEQTGERLIDYINKVRINKAKEIIVKEDMNMDRISDIVGFSSLRTFMRVFKNYEGSSPGRYKKASVIIKKDDI